HAIGECVMLIRDGRQDVMVAGGAEAPICLMGVGGFSAMRALATSFNDEPERASRPFDARRDGFVIAEGAGVLVLEELEHARRRGAHVYAELVGYGATCDAYHMTQPAPEGAGAAECMRHALDDAGIEPGAIGYINAHGTGTPFNDEAETLAVKRVFGAHAARLSISSTKSMTGHLLGAAGAAHAGGRDGAGEAARGPARSGGGPAPLRPPRRRARRARGVPEPRDPGEAPPRHRLRQQDLSVLRRRRARAEGADDGRED